MPNIELAKSSLLTAPSVPVSVLDDTAVMLEIWHDGQDAAGTPVASATIGCTSSSFTFKINGDVDSRIGSSGVIDATAAAYNTVTEFAAAVNKVAGWYCRVICGLPASSMNATTVDITANTNCYKTTVPCLIDTDAALFHAWCITSTRGVATHCAPGTTYANKINAIYNERNHKNVLYYAKWNATHAGSTTHKCYFYSAHGPSEVTNTIGYIVPAASTTVNTFDFTKAPLTARDNERLILYVSDTSLAITESLVLGKSIKT